MAKSAADSFDFGLLEKIALGQMRSPKGDRRVIKTVFAPDSKLTGSGRELVVKYKRLVEKVEGLTKAAENQRSARELYVLWLAKRALGTEALADKFLKRKHPALGVSPISKLETEWGARQVEDLLFGMIHGLPS